MVWTNHRALVVSKSSFTSPSTSSSSISKPASSNSDSYSNCSRHRKHRQSQTSTGVFELSAQQWTAHVSHRDEIYAQFALRLFLENQLLPTTTEDTYLFQQGNDASLCTKELRENANRPIAQMIASSSSTDASGGKRCVVERESVARSLSEVKNASLPVTADCEITQTNVKCRQPDVVPVPDEVPADLPVTVHSYQLTFCRPLAQRQRSQYLTDIVCRSRKKSDSISMWCIHDSSFSF